MGDPEIPDLDQLRNGSVSIKESNHPSAHESVWRSVEEFEEDTKKPFATQGGDPSTDSAGHAMSDSMEDGTDRHGRICVQVYEGWWDFLVTNCIARRRLAGNEEVTYRQKIFLARHAKWRPIGKLEEEQAQNTSTGTTLLRIKLINAGLVAYWTLLL